jgi:hypothetical protein
MSVQRLAWSLLVLMLLLPWSVLAQGPRSVPVIGTAPNESTVGTTLNYLAKIVPPASGTLGVLRKPLVTDTTLRLVVVHANAGTTGSALYTSVGDANCFMDGTNASGMAGKPVLMSTTTAGQCHVETGTLPTSVMVIGYMKADETTVDKPALIDLLNQPIGPGGSFTGVTSVGLSMPAEYTVAPATITTSGVFTVSKASQAANLVWASPNGSAGAPGFRALVAADVPGVAGSCGTTGDLTGTYPNCTVFQATNKMEMKGEAALSGVFATTVSGQLNDYAPGSPAPGFTGASRVLLDPGSSTVIITGFGARGNGDMKKVCNSSTTGGLLVLKHQYTGTGASSAANRLLLSSNATSMGEQDDVTLTQGLCVSLWYQTAPLQRWRLDEGTVPDAYKIRPIGTIVGDPDSASPTLTENNDTPQGWQNHYGRDAKVLHLACYADAGAPTIQVTWAGSATSVLTADCQCGIATFAPCSVVTTGTNMLIHSWASTASTRTCTTPPCGLDFKLLTSINTTGTRYIVVDGYTKLQ